MSVFWNPSHEKIKRGDIKEFEKVFKAYYTPLCYFVNKMLDNTEVSRELVSDFFYHYWKNRETIHISSSLKAYMYQSVRNRALKFIEHQRVEKKYEGRVLENTSTEPSNLHDEMELAEMSQIIERTLVKMPGRCREIFLLSREQGLKYREIAERLGVSVKTVEASMGKALQMFRESLGDYGPTVSTG
jgi:RNA polymerase sigma-70 factor, ECF subfamily